jgi:hypothetical protein
MDWLTIKVLTKNLKEILQEIETGSHLYEDDFGMSCVKNTWSLSVITLSKSLQNELGHAKDDSGIHSSWEHFKNQGLEKNPYVRDAIDIATLADKLLADYDQLKK